METHSTTYDDHQEGFVQIKRPINNSGHICSNNLNSRSLLKSPDKHHNDTTIGPIYSSLKNYSVGLHTRPIEHNINYIKSLNNIKSNVKNTSPSNERIMNSGLRRFLNAPPTPNDK
jgi:hypothetical protein